MKSKKFYNVDPRIGCYTRMREAIQANGGAIGGVIIIFVFLQVRKILDWP
jgi:hypothetical protein